MLAGVRRLEPLGADRRQCRAGGHRPRSRESIEAFDREVDVLVNNAGQFTAGLLETQDVDAIYAMLQVNLLGTIHLTRHVLPGCWTRGRGKMVINSSVVAYANFPAVTTYAASKAGISGFAEALRRELAPTPLTTLHIVTGGIDTDMLDETKAQLEPHFAGAGAGTSTRRRRGRRRSCPRSRPTIRCSGPAARPRWASSRRTCRAGCSTRRRPAFDRS